MPFPLRCLLLLLATAGILACTSDFAPTGAKGGNDAFGRMLYMDEECGALDDPDYPGFFANAMFRDGAIARGRMWMVDGSHLWSLPMGTPGFPDIKLEKAFVGHGNAVAADDNLIALALVDGGVMIFPDHDLDVPIALGTTRAIDVALDDNLLAVADGAQGIHLYDVADPWWPTPLTTITVPGYAAGVRWQQVGTQRELYFAACSHVGRILFEGDDPVRHQISDRLPHTNAKDAHGDGTWLLAANNGSGVWFLPLPTLDEWTRYDMEDPNFYANSVQVVGEMAYIAAGNREILALRTDFPARPIQDPPAFQRDPLSILVDGDDVYGFGNFRDVGERTVVRTNTIHTRDDRARFAMGMTSWTEPRPYFDVTTHYAGVPTGDVERLYWWTPNGGQMYESALTEPVWRVLPGLAFEGSAGDYAVTVTSDGHVRVTASGATTSEILFENLGTGYLLGGWAADGEHSFMLGAPDGSVHLYRYDEGLGWRSFQTHSDIAPSPHNWTFKDGRPTQRSTPSGELCRFPTRQEEGGRSRNVLHGEGSHPEWGDYRWCSRLVDPHMAGRRPDDDYGARIHEASANTGWVTVDDDGEVDPYVHLWESGVTQVVPVSAGWLGLVDDRKAVTASVVLWDPQGQEIRRFTRLGKPLGWRPNEDDEQVRVWLADGSAFTLDLVTWQPMHEVQPLAHAGGAQ